MSNQLHFFEDYQIGQQGKTVTRTVTAADLVNFACLTADYSGAHLDRHYMANSIYGERVAHGLLGSSLVTGMLSIHAPHVLGRGVPGAYLYSFDANYRDAIKVEDTINIQWRVAKKASDPNHAGCGLVTTAFRVVNQEEVPIYDGTIAIVVPEKSAENTKPRLEPGEAWQLEEYIPDPDRIYYAEDYPPGKGGDTDGRTITETDIVNFTGLTGDYDPQYVDTEFARKGMFGERIAPPMLIFTIAFGLWTSVWDRYTRPKVRFAGHLTDASTFLAPVKIGDTIRCRYKNISSRVSKSKPEVGVNTFGLQVLNQRNEAVQDGYTIMMIGSKAGQSK